MVRCCQCGKQAIIQYQFGPLCLDCNLKFRQTQQIEISELERQMNFTLDMMEDVSGVPIRGRFPERRPVLLQNAPVTTNNINMDKSIVGNVNTGTVSKLNTSMNSVSLQNTEETTVIKSFSESVLREDSINKEQKELLLKQITFLTDQLAAKKSDRNIAVIDVVLNSIGVAIAAVPHLAPLFTQLTHLYH